VVEVMMRVQSLEDVEVRMREHVVEVRINTNGRGEDKSTIVGGCRGDDERREHVVEVRIRVHVVGVRMRVQLLLEDVELRMREHVVELRIGVHVMEMRMRV
jgi:hypothetical protein